MLTLTLVLLERAIVGTAVVEHCGMDSSLWIGKKLGRLGE